MILEKSSSTEQLSHYSMNRLKECLTGKNKASIHLYITDSIQ